MIDLLSIILGFFLGFICFSVVILPIFYGFPKAAVWAFRHWLLWRVTVYWFISPIIWTVLFVGVAICIIVIYPNIEQKVVNLFDSAWAAGLLFGTLRALTSSGRRDLRDDFLDRMKLHLTPEGAAANAYHLSGLTNDNPS